MSYTNEEIATKQYVAWDILVERTRNKLDQLTYTEIADLVGLGKGYYRKAGLFLYPTQDFCERRGLPPLTVMVKHSGGGYGEGFRFAPYASENEAKQAVLDFDGWNLIRDSFFGISNLREKDQLRRKLEEVANDKSSIGATEHRGRRQSLFHALLYKIYGGCCAVCSINREEMLDAAHIKPWSESGAEEKVDPANGLLLCKNHHAAFDAKLWWIDKDGEVIARTQEFHELLGLRGTLRLPTDMEDSPLERLAIHRRKNSL